MLTTFDISPEAYQKMVNYARILINKVAKNKLIFEPSDFVHEAFCKFENAPSFDQMRRAIGKAIAAEFSYQTDVDDFNGKNDYKKKQKTAICSKCNDDKPIGKFTPRRKGSSRQSTVCRDCVNKANRVIVKKCRFKYPDPYIITEQQCISCKNILPVNARSPKESAFKIVVRRDRIYIFASCRKCNGQGKPRVKPDPEDQKRRRRESAKKYYNLHKDTVKEKARNYVPKPGLQRLRLNETEKQKIAREMSLRAMSQIKKIYPSLDLTIKDIAYLVGLTSQYVTRLLNGKANITMENLVLFEKALNLCVRIEVGLERKNNN